MILTLCLLSMYKNLYDTNASLRTALMARKVVDYPELIRKIIQQSLFDIDEQQNAEQEEESIVH